MDMLCVYLTLYICYHRLKLAFMVLSGKVHT
jgi:hypothetical protein